jgi:DNA anti-recombination protein RmuC
VRSIVDLRLKQLQEDNAKQIDKMRSTVDEKLQGTLEKRLGESRDSSHARTSAGGAVASKFGGEHRARVN